jgi:putative DNA primase/helicase
VTIFLDNAPLYWAVGLQVIPLGYQNKRPIPKGYQNYSSTPIPDELRAQWIHNYPDNNMGLVCGAQSGVVLLDVDSLQQRVYDAIDQLLPPSPYERRGMKGYIRAYRYDPKNAKSWQIIGEDGKPIVEFLSNLRQGVMPPSIHPETKLPYTANSLLYDPAVLAALHILPPDFNNLLRAALTAKGVVVKNPTKVNVSAPVVQGARDVQMIRVAGHFAQGVLKKELTFCEARDQMVGWHDVRVEKIDGDELDIDKGVSKIAEFLLRDVTIKGRSLPDGWDFDLSEEERTAYGFDVFTADHQKYSYSEMKEWVLQQMMVHEPSSEGAQSCLVEIITRIARSDLDQLSTDALLNYARKVTGFKDVRLETLRKDLLRQMSNGIKGDNHQEIAENFLEELSSETQHCYNLGEFYSWEGTQWRVIDKVALQARIGKVYGGLPLGKRASDHAAVAKVCAGIINVPALNTSGLEGINFTNGFLSIQRSAGIKLLPHAPEYGATYTMEWGYDPNISGKFPRFAQFVTDCWGHDDDLYDKIVALQQALAVTLIGSASIMQRAILLHGAPLTGKSVLLKIVQKLLPMSAQSAIPPDRWSERFDTSGLVGKLLNVCGELHEKRKIEGQKFKQIICGETTRMERKGLDGFDYEPRAIHWFASNHLPSSTDTSEGFTRRWLILHFNKIVPPGQRVVDLADIIIREEGEAIVAWVAQMADQIARNGFDPSQFVLPKTHHSQMRQMQSRNNGVLAFVRDSGLVMLGNMVSQSSAPTLENPLYNAYYFYASEVEGARPVSLNTFREMMSEVGSSLGFKLQEVRGTRGEREFVYENITLASKRTGAA